MGKETTMKFHFLRWPDTREAELTIFLGRLQIRIGTHQFAAWWHKGNYNFIEFFSFCRERKVIAR